jgi:hypothetical protein
MAALRWLAFDGAGRSIGVAHDGSPLAGQVTMRLWKCAVLVIAGALAIGGVALYLTYSRDLQAINARLVAGSQVVETSHGPVEYATLGDDPTVLVIHGLGGGYDQGLLLAKAFGRWRGFPLDQPIAFRLLAQPSAGRRVHGGPGGRVR